MKTIILKNEELDKELSVNVYDNWNEVQFKNYFIIQELEQGNKEDQIEYTLNMIEAISNAKKQDLLDYSNDELLKVIEVFQNIGEINKDKLKDFIIIDSTIYVPKKNMKNITASEMIYIKQMQKQSKNDKEVSLAVLAILLRPGYKKEVDGVEKYIQNPLDEEGIEARKELFLNRLSINEVLPLLSFFLTGINN
jgi:hypothetical protein